MRILICEFFQESNSFNPELTTRENFAYTYIYTDGELLEKCRNTQTMLGGILGVLDAAGAEVIPSCAMYSTAGGPVEQAVVDGFVRDTIAVIRANQPFDGACVSLHGATQSTEMEDVCGYILQEFRKELGPDVVISASFDLHANITQRIRDNADFICGFHTYPHVDFYDTGHRAAELCVRRLQSGDNLGLFYAEAPMLVSASTYTTMRGPFGELIQDGKRLVAGGKIADFSVFQAQPWLDVSCCAGAEVIIFADKDGPARSYVEELISRLWRMRGTFRSNSSSVEEVIQEAERNTSGKPVLLVDSSDSVHAGACGDSAFVLQKLLETGSPIKAALPVVDVPAVEKAFQVGVGWKGKFCLGATKDARLTSPVEAEAQVRSLHDGCFINEGPALAGQSRNLGRTAVLTVGNIDVLVTTTVSQPGDPQFFRHFGIEPLFYQMLVVKACTSFRAAFERIAEKIFYADAPGAASPDLNALPFRHVPAYFYPFSDTAEYRAEAHLRD